MSSSDSDLDFQPDFYEEAKEGVKNVLAPKSKEKYLKSYENFMKWRAEKKVKSFSENVLLVYFSELSKTHKPSTLWSVYSMLKTTLRTKHNVHLKDFGRVTLFLKKQAVGFRYKVFTSQEVETFLSQAPDEIYLVMKVVLILAMSGASRSIELVNMKVDDIEKHDDIILVKLRGTQTKYDRTLVVKKEFVNVIEKYQLLRPSAIETDRFFLNYKKGKCLRQVIGINKISSIPKEVATYLNLPNPNLYSLGHCFRGTSATYLAESGTDLGVIKRHGDWKSSKAAEGYIRKSVENKTNIPHRVKEMINLHSTDYPQASTSKDYPMQSKNIAVTAEENIQISKSPTFTQESLDTVETQVSRKILKIHIPGKNISITVTDCSDVTINFK